MSKKVFISYARDNAEEGQKFVVELAHKLTEYKVYAASDCTLVYCDIAKMMKEGIEQNGYDKIIVVASKEYTIKANEHRDGVGEETKMLEIVAKEDPSKIVVIKREECELPRYLRTRVFVDFSRGITQEKIEELARRINDLPEYEPPIAAKDTKEIKSKSLLDDLIVDLQYNEEKERLRFLLTELKDAYMTVKELLERTKAKTPGLKIHAEFKRQKHETGAWQMVGESLIPIEQELQTCEFGVEYNGKQAGIMLWMNIGSDDRYPKIYGSEVGWFERNFGQNYNSWNMSYYAEHEKGQWQLRGMLDLDTSINNGKELGKRIYKMLMAKVKQ